MDIINSKHDIFTTTKTGSLKKLAIQHFREPYYTYMGDSRIS